MTHPGDGDKQVSFPGGVEDWGKRAEQEGLAQTSRHLEQPRRGCGFISQAPGKALSQWVVQGPEGGAGPSGRMPRSRTERRAVGRRGRQETRPGFDPRDLGSIGLRRNGGGEQKGPSLNPRAEKRKRSRVNGLGGQEPGSSSAHYRPLRGALAPCHLAALTPCHQVTSVSSETVI